MEEVFHLKAPFQPTGDQPQAIEALVQGIEEGDDAQTLLGVTGSGKTFTMANIIARCNRPTLISGTQQNPGKSDLHGDAQLFSRMMRWNILSPTTITISRKPTSLLRIPTLKRTALSMTRLTVCAIPPRLPCRNSATSSLWPAFHASIPWATPSITAAW